MKKKSGLSSFLDQVSKELDGISNDFAEGVKRKLISDASNLVVDSIFSPTPAPAQTVPNNPAPFQKAANPKLSSMEGYKENLTWFPGGQNGRANPVTLSAPTDHYNTSALITRLCPGDVYCFRFRVLKVDQGGDFDHALQFMLADEKGVESGWYFSFQSGKEKIVASGLKIDNQFQGNQKYELTRYLVDKINEIVLTYDGKYMRSSLNGSPIPAHFIKSGSEFTLVFRVVGMDITFWG